MNDPNIRAPRLLERYREEMLVRRYANRTITGYVSWVRRYLRFHHLRDPLAHCCSSIAPCLVVMSAVWRVSCWAIDHNDCPLF